MKQSKQKRLSFAPLGFDEVITDVLKIKPEPKATTKRKATRKGRDREKAK